MPNGALAISLQDGDKTPSHLAFAAVLQPPLCFPAIFLVIGSSPSLFFLVLGYFLVWPCCPYVVCIAVAVLAVLSLRGTPWFPCRRYAGNSTFKQHNKVPPPLGHWNPETLEPPSRSTGTLEPRDIGTASAQGGERARTREPGMGTDPRNGFLFSGTPWQSLAVSPLRVSLPSRSWRLRRPGWCTLAAGAGEIPRRFNHADRGRSREVNCRFAQIKKLSLFGKGCLTHIRSIMKGQTTSTVSVGKITRGFYASCGRVASSFEREDWMTLQTSRQAAHDHRHERRCLRRRTERMNSNNNTSCDNKSTGRSICS